MGRASSHVTSFNLQSKAGKDVPGSWLGPQRGRKANRLQEMSMAAANAAAIKQKGQTF